MQRTKLIYLELQVDNWNGKRIKNISKYIINFHSMVVSIVL